MQNYHFGVSTMSDAGEQQNMMKKHGLIMLGRESWLNGRGPDCYHSYEKYLFWKGEKNLPTQVKELSYKEMFDVVREFPHRDLNVWTSLAKLGLPESIKDCPGVLGYATSYNPNWTPDTPYFEKYEDGYEHQLHPTRNYPPLKGHGKIIKRFYTKGEIKTFGICMTPGFIRAVAALDGVSDLPEPEGYEKFDRDRTTCRGRVWSQQMRLERSLRGYVLVTDIQEIGGKERKCDHAWLSCPAKVSLLQQGQDITFKATWGTHYSSKRGWVYGPLSDQWIDGRPIELLPMEVA